MSTCVCIHQPDFAPYLGFFHRLLEANHLIILDDVQFLRRGWHHRDKIKSKNGPVWLTLSLLKGPYTQKICDVHLSSEPNWVNKNLNLLKECYKNTLFFDEIYTEVEQIYTYGYKKLIDINMAILKLAFEYLDINIPLSYSSTYHIDTKKSQRLLELVQTVGGSQYLTGTGSKDYLNEKVFKQENIEVLWQYFKHPVYNQQYGEFIPELSCLDLLFNCGRESALVLRSTS